MGNKYRAIHQVKTIAGLSSRTKGIIYNAFRTYRTSDPDEIMSVIEESLYVGESEGVRKMLEYIDANNSPCSEKYMDELFRLANNYYSRGEN